MKRKKIAVIGAGSWGTALAILLSRMGYQVFLWCHDAQKATLMARERVTPYLSGITLPKKIHISDSIESVVEGAEIIFSVVPSKHLRNIISLCSYHTVNNATIISCTKGIESGTLLRMSQVIHQVIPDAKVFALSGPTFAIEVANGKPTAAVIAGKDEDDLKYLQDLFSSEAELFRLYRSTDIVGVELGGALKNIIAIAAGISDGLKFGDNARSMLFSRGLAEIINFALAYGAKTKTLYGLAGIGDLMLTASSNKSRNYQLGFRIGRGEKLSHILDGMMMVVEGTETINTALEMAARREIEMPIAEQLAEVLFNDKDPQNAVWELMGRDLKEE
ncbi:MAG: NAD(P)H-dependent glycerol-3-phosphate dehydrogenase [bacterium]